MTEARQRLLFGGASEQPGAPDANADVPSPQQVAVLEAYLGLVGDRGAIEVEELERLVAVAAGLDPADPATERLLSDIEVEVLGNPASPVTMLAPDVVVHVPALTDGIVLTHRISGVELDEEHVELDTDLAGFLRCLSPRVAAGPLHVDGAEGDEAVLWGGPRGWLARLPVGAVVAVRASTDGEVTISVLDAAPAAPPELVEAVRAAYDVELGEAGLPVSAENLLLAMRHRDRAVLAEPGPPLTELAAAAGLELRGDEFAHDESVWAAADVADRAFRLVSRAGAGEHGAAALVAFELLAGDPHDPATLRGALELLQEPDVLVSVVDELLEPDEPVEPGKARGHVGAVVALADRLVAAAGSSPRAAVARWFAAIAAERDGRAVDAESHLRAASVAADGWALVEDRLAWYESDRGDAAAALGRWRSVEAPDDDPDVAVLLPFAAAAPPEPGRNEPCWCGSGRKYKQCHLGKPVVASLSERADWLYRKAMAYLERRGGAAEEAWERYAEAGAGEDEDIEDVFTDPLVVDTVLHEGGWFERFLADRGPLLPADEAELAASWSTVDRSVHEVVGIRFGKGLTVRDLRTGDEAGVDARTDVTVGELLCARVVPDGSGPDGDGRRFLGAVLVAPRGRERELLELLGQRDGLALLQWGLPDL